MFSKNFSSTHREKCPKTEFFVVRILRTRKIRYLKHPSHCGKSRINSVFEHPSRCGKSRTRKIWYLNTLQAVVNHTDQENLVFEHTLRWGKSWTTKNRYLNTLQAVVNHGLKKFGILTHFTLW